MPSFRERVSAPLWLAYGLADGATSNLWFLSTSDRSWRQIADFGDEPDRHRPSRVMVT